MRKRGNKAEEGKHSQGHYANFFKVGYNAFEFLIDCGQYYPENHEAQFHFRIITNPAYAKALFEILRESITQYEETYGIISQ